MQIQYSIIVPVYNVAPYLAACLDSVLRQCVTEWECICVDDGSTDGSSDMLDAYQKKDGRFKVIHKNNEGVSSARNVALNICAGKWIVYLDADDVLVKDALSIFAKIEKEVPDATLMHYDIGHISEEASDCQVVQDIGLCQVFHERDRSKIVPGYNGISFVTYAYRRENFGQMRYKRYAIGEDRLYLANAHSQCRCKAWCNAIGYGCRQRRNSASRSVWTLQKYTDSVNARRDSIAVVESTGVQFSRLDLRTIYNALLEASVADVCLVDKKFKQQAWEVLFGALNVLNITRIPTCWQRIVLRALCKTHSPFLGYWLCIVPRRLKALKSRYRKWRRNKKQKEVL